MKTVWKGIGLFAGGVLFGTAGVGILSSRDAKKAYTHTTAAVLRAKECIMTTVTRMRENADDIVSDAVELNERRAVENEEEELADMADRIADDPSQK